MVSLIVRSTAKTLLYHTWTTNFEALTRLAWNVDPEVGEIWNSRAEAAVGSEAAPQVVAALKLSQGVIEKSLVIRELNFTDHSGYPTSIPRTWEITWDWSNYCYPDSHERPAITPDNIGEVIHQKDDALTTAREMLRLIGGSRSHLPEEPADELHERTEWLLHSATIKRYLAELCFRMLLLEEMTKNGETDAAQLVDMTGRSPACRGPRQAAQDGEDGELLPGTARGRRLFVVPRVPVAAGALGRAPCQVCPNDERPRG